MFNKRNVLTVIVARLQQPTDSFGARHGIFVDGWLAGTIAMAGLYFAGSAIPPTASAGPGDRNDGQRPPSSGVTTHFEELGAAVGAKLLWAQSIEHAQLVRDRITEPVDRLVGGAMCAAQRLLDDGVDNA